MASSRLTHTLQAGLSQLPPGGIVVGFSGGLDSSVLLHALAGLAPARERGLRALHVDHGLHARSTHWATHCAAFAGGLGVPFTLASATVSAAGDGLEAAARDARYRAFSEHLQPGETLALAHHADDQAETVLLKLLRGAGPQGLGGMRSRREFGRGWLWRPLLDLPRAALRDHAQAHGLHWIDDPSNADTHLRRNFLRAEIVPRLAQRWPEATTAIAHSASWARAAADFVDEHARRALASLLRADAAAASAGNGHARDASALDWRGWLLLPDALRDPVLRLWLRSQGHADPAHFHVAELERQLHAAADDRAPCVRWDCCELRRYRDLLYAMTPLTPVATDWQAGWDGSLLALPAGGTIELRAEAGPIAHPPGQPALVVHYRRGGEHIKPAGGAHTRELRALLQEAGIPPWRRARIPLISLDGELIAVADRVLSAAAMALCAQRGVRIVWKQ